MILLLVACASFLPGLLRRWITYRRRLADLLRLLSVLLLCLASAWQIWAGTSATVFRQLIVSGLLWSLAALAVFLAFVQNFSVEAEYVRARLAGRTRWQRILFHIGFVEFGRSPKEMHRWLQQSKGNTTAFGRSGKETAFFVVIGAAIAGIGLILAFELGPRTAGGRIGTLLTAFGLLAMAGAAVDGFVLLARKSTPQSDPTHCPYCQYQLRGLAERRCPECGEPF